MLSTEGQEICAIAHFSHRPGKHGAQWRKLLGLLVTIPCEHKVLMADHNSLIVPSRDSKPVSEDKNKTILEARATETQILQKLQLEDAYVNVHSDPLDRQDHPEGFTFGFGVSDETSDTEDDSEEHVTQPHNLRRIDRIHVTSAIRDCRSSAYTAHVARADHKAVHVTCQPPAFDDSPPRLRCYEEFLEDEECVSHVLHRIFEIEAPPKDWWDVAVHIIHREALAYHREVSPPQDYNIMGMVLTSTKHRVCPQAWAYLRSKGHCPQSEAAAYSILVALSEKGRTDKTGTILLGKLKGIVGGEEMSMRSGIDRQRQINKLMSELQCRRRLGAMKDATGRQLSKPVQIATALKDHWEAVSKEGLMTIEDGTTFLESLPLPPNSKQMARALFRPLTRELVDEA